MARGGDRGDRFGDLFDDLDRFFGPEGVEEAGASTEPAGPDRSEVASSGGPGRHELGEDLLPPGWEPDVEALDLGAEGSTTDRPGQPEGGAPEDAQGARAEGGQWGGESEEPGAPGPEDRAGPESTAEMTGDDWARLREALGEGRGGIDEVPEGPGEASGAAPEAGLEEGRPEGLGEEAGEPDELTVEDLRKAPPEYEELPGAEQAVPEASGREGPGAGEAEAGPGEDAGVWAAAGEEAEAPPEAEPEISEVERAADRLAAEFGPTPPPEEVEEELLADLNRPGRRRTVRVGEPEGMTGPTWEEPTSRPILAEPGGLLAEERNVPAAILSALALAAVALLALAWSKVAFAVVAGAIVLVGQAELYLTMQRRGYQPATALGLAVGALTLAGAYHRGEQAMAFFVLSALFLTILWYMAAAPRAREGLVRNVGATMLGVLYVPFTAGYALLILTQSTSGRGLLLAVLGLTFLYDVAAFAAGSLYGRRPLAPTVSPRKSWEGLIVATIVTFAVAVAFLPSVVDVLTLSRTIWLALVVVVFAPLGDLVESAIKRDLGVKDMGTILPGHGGVLDRIDSVLLVAPAAFYFLRLIF